MIPFALVHLKDAVDLLGTTALVSGVWFSWERLSRKAEQRRIERKERQAEFKRRMLRAERERAEALRYFGAGVR